MELNSKRKAQSCWVVYRSCSLIKCYFFQKKGKRIVRMYSWRKHRYMDMQCFFFYLNCMNTSRELQRQRGREKVKDHTRANGKPVHTFYKKYSSLSKMSWRTWHLCVLVKKNNLHLSSLIFPMVSHMFCKESLSGLVAASVYMTYAPGGANRMQTWCEWDIIKIKGVLCSLRVGLSPCIVLLWR